MLTYKFLWRSGLASCHADPEVSCDAVVEPPIMLTHKSPVAQWYIERPAMLIHKSPLAQWRPGMLTNKSPVT